jgi:hypothetical protein
MNFRRHVAGQPSTSGNNQASVTTPAARLIHSPPSRSAARRQSTFSSAYPLLSMHCRISARTSGGPVIEDIIQLPDAAASRAATRRAAAGATRAPPSGRYGKSGRSTTPLDVRYRLSRACVVQVVPLREGRRSRRTDCRWLRQLRLATNRIHRGGIPHAAAMIGSRRVRQRAAVAKRTRPIAHEKRTYRGQICPDAQQALSRGDPPG